MTNKIKQILQISIIISVLGICMIGCTPVTGTPNTYTTPTIEQPNQPQQEYVLRVEDNLKTHEFVIKTLDKNTWKGTWYVKPISESTYRLRYFELIDPDCDHITPDYLQETDENGNHFSGGYYCIRITEVGIEGRYYTGIRNQLIEILKQ